MRLGAGEWAVRDPQGEEMGKCVLFLEKTCVGSHSPPTCLEEATSDPEVWCEFLSTPICSFKSIFTGVNQALRVWNTGPQSVTARPFF